MGQVLHGCARTTAAVRRAIQSSQESLIALAERYDINPKTVHKWRKRSSVVDAPMGPKPRSTTLSEEQEATPWLRNCVPLPAVTFMFPPLLTSIVPWLVMLPRLLSPPEKV